MTKIYKFSLGIHELNLNIELKIYISCGLSRFSLGKKAEQVPTRKITHKVNKAKCLYLYHKPARHMADYMYFYLRQSEINDVVVTFMRTDVLFWKLITNYS